MTPSEEALLARVNARLAQNNVEGIKKSVKTRIKPDTEVLMRKVKRPTFTPPPMPDLGEGLYHQRYDDLLRVMSIRRWAWLVGPAGSGKTKGVFQAAEQLGLPHAAPPIGEDTSIAQLIGYRDANGSVVRTPLRECWEHGGVILFDEFDNASSSVGTALNALTGNDEYTFPDGVVKRHKDFILVATGNTYGTGATRQYVGRNQLDAATLNRFVFIEWPYDTQLEHAVSINRYWTNYVQSARKHAEDLGILHIISPRASIAGGELLACGFAPDEVARMVLWQGLDKASVDKIEHRLGSFAAKDSEPTIQPAPEPEKKETIETLYDKFGKHFSKAEREEDTMKYPTPYMRKAPF